ncbi:hypothetical protein [Streptomyces hokutonensis]|uniref:hypothetical protein n=1 Tax=Streptomyces hokutonensis TaxID=1306990 RepID=UPI0003706379|nr:hypothetical protein [Streptomyces hokutonensis]
MKFIWEITLGDVVTVVLSVAAITIAVWQLVTSRRDLVKERRADFRAEQLAAIAVTLEHSGDTGDASVSARLRFLPADWHMPVLRTWGEVPYSPTGLNDLQDLWEQDGSPQVPGGLIGWVRQRGRAEIAAATAKVLEE